MAKPKKPQSQGFTFEGYDQRQFKRSDQYAAAIDQLYNAAVADFAKLADQIKLNPDECFSFDQMPSLQKKAQQIVNQLASKMTAVIQHGSKESWLYACQKNDAFLAHIMNTAKIGKRQLKRMQDKNLTALEAFQTRKAGGMDLSQRVWKYAGETKSLIEMGLDITIGDGTPAGKIAKDLKQYLQEPNKLFRRVRDKHGNLVISKRAAAYHPGRGVYRSSYQNAMRMARTEVNMAYRDSDRYRWNQLDFVVGYEVKLSNNHTLKDHKGPYHDICDELAGRYPKTFVFKGWHPNCRCFMVPILKDPKEFKTDQENALRDAFWGEDDDFDAAGNYQKYMKPEESVNAVTDVPKNFKSWAAANLQRSLTWAKQPYFIKDNFTGGTLEGDLKIVKPVIPRPKDDPNEDRWNEFRKADDKQKKTIFEQMEREFYKLWDLYAYGRTPLERSLKQYGIDYSLLRSTLGDLFEIVHTDVNKLTKDQIVSFYTKIETAKSEINRLQEELKRLTDVEYQNAQPIFDQATAALKRLDRWDPTHFHDGIHHMENFVKQERAEANPNWPQLAQKAEEVIDDCEQVINAKKRQQMVTISQMNPLITEGEKLKIDERFMNDLRDLIAINVEDPGSIRYPEWKKEADKRLQMIRDEIQRKKDANVVPFDEIQKVAKINGVTPLAVKKFKDQPTDRQIIERVCGSDMTKGSCSSLAFTYAGNKCGFDVLDFRGGMSREIFATSGNINRIAKDVGGIVNEDYNDFKNATTLLGNCVEGKEYYFTCGGHAAVVRKTKDGFEYLELQSPCENGWKPLDKSVLKNRFRAKQSHTVCGMKISSHECLIDIDLFKKISGFDKMLQYINTEPDKQRKGAQGHIR